MATNESHKHTISGPGASDFLSSPSGEDIPGISPNKGMSETKDESHFTDPKNLVPRLGPDTEAHPGERSPDEEPPASSTGTQSVTQDSEVGRDR